jgi:septum formation protein
MPERDTAPLILASASPRRKQLLSEAGYEFSVIRPEVDESAFDADGTGPAGHAKRLALAKAKSVAHKHPDSLVIGADTIVDFQGRIIGKAADAKEAEQITRELFSSPHKVITGVAIIRQCDNTELVRSDSTTVYPKKFVERIEGSLTNVMGLPMELLESLLTGLNIQLERKQNE